MAAKLDNLFRKMVEMGASDLHLTSNSPPIWRVSGDMLPDKDIPPIPPNAMFELLREIAPKDKLEEFVSSGDVDFAYELPEGRFRANFFKDRYGPGAVFRYITSKIITVEELGLSDAIIELCKLPKGLVLVTGPTGSGKSTTLCALMDYINRHKNAHIITIEDPIEFTHSNKKCLINQREVSIHTGSFKKALRAALREDPDILLIGEMRDLETTEIAIEMAETGHLVFGTLHTTTAAATVERIIQQFPGDKQNQIRLMLASSLKGVISQSLCKKVDGKGRVAAMEILISNFAVANLIREGKTHQILSVMQTSAKDGMVLLNDVLSDLVKKGIVTRDEALSKSADKIDLLNKINGY
jgi:twitching motility protein PilT